MIWLMLWWFCNSDVRLCRKTGNEQNCESVAIKFIHNSIEDKNEEKIRAETATFNNKLKITLEEKIHTTL